MKCFSSLAGGGQLRLRRRPETGERTKGWEVNCVPASGCWDFLESKGFRDIL